MTGYQAKMGPMMPDPVGNEVVPSVYVKTVSPDHTIVVADGDRIDLRPWYSAKSALLIQGANSTYAALQAYRQVQQRTCGSLKVAPPWGPANGTDTIDPGVGSDRVAIDFTVASDNKTSCTTSRITLENRAFTLDSPPLDLSTDPWIYTNNLTGNYMSKEWLRTSTICQPQRKYAWGFSSLLLFCFCITTVLFLGCLLSLQLDLWWNSKSDRIEHSFSVNRDILNLALAIHEHAPGGDAADFTDPELDDLVKERTSGMEVDTEQLPKARKDQPQKSKRCPPSEASYLFVGLND